MMQREKAGGHTERSVAIGTIEIGAVGRRRQDRGQAAASRAGRPLQRRQARRQDFLLRRRRLVLAGRDAPDRAGRDAPPSRRRLHHAEDEGRRPAARRRHEARRGGEVDPAGRHAARGRRQLQVQPRRGARLREGAGAVQAALVRGAVRSARLCDARGDRLRLRRRAVDRREPVLDAGRGEPGAVRRTESRHATT